MNAVVVGASAAPGREDAYREVIAGHDLIVGADAGALLCLRLGIAPALAVGDFDSAGTDGLARLREAGVPIEEHPASKDASDLDLAIAAARRLGATRLTLTGVSGGRPDHALAAFGSLLAAADLGAVLREPGWMAVGLVAGVREEIAIDLGSGTAVSIVSPGGAGGVTTHGLEYALEDAALAPLSSLGVSNQAVGGACSVSVTSGSLIVFAQATGERFAS